jgi:protein TonB
MLNSKFDLYKTEWLDLVFADRNKSYGAYDLRIHYGDNMLKALAITMVGFTLAAGAFTIAFKHDVVEKPPVEQIVPDIPIAPMVEPKKEKPVEAIKRTQPAKAEPVKPATTSPQVNIKTQAFPVPKISNQANAIDMPKLDPNVAISSTNNEGDATKPTTGILDGTNTAGTGGKPGVVDGDDNSPHDIGGLDVMPEPVGGNAAWAKFLQKNLRYPDTEVQGRVIISFIIEKDGHLTDLKVLKGVVTELDREAMRVLKLAPAWKPGLQNGKPVRVKYTIPIVFQISE